MVCLIQFLAVAPLHPLPLREAQDCYVFKAYGTANSENSINFLKYLQILCPEQRIAVFWDGASYYRSEELQVNHILAIVFLEIILLDKEGSQP